MRNAGSISVRGDGRELDCFLAFPDGEDSAEHDPAVIVIHEIFGPDAHIQDVCRRITGLGYVAAAPDPSPASAPSADPGQHRARHAGIRPGASRPSPGSVEARGVRRVSAARAPPRPRGVRQGQLAPGAGGVARDLLAVAQYLRGLPEVDPTRIASVGFCFGGAMSARLATVDPELKAAVIFYGQNPPLDAVPRIHARVLGFYGSEDPGITQTVPALAAAMAAAGKKFEYRVYPSAKHAFFNDTRPTYHRMSANDAWDTMVRFFGENLNG